MALGVYCLLFNLSAISRAAREVDPVQEVWLEKEGTEKAHCFRLEKRKGGCSPRTLATCSDY